MTFAALTLAVSLAAQAAPPPAPSPTVVKASAPVVTPQASDVAAKDVAAEKPVCRYVRSADSMIGGKNECHTRAAWSRIAHQQ